ncbi:MAG: hypothetical protein FK734_07565 [Asgard group archaeon]|nr:hypothetical protein [Asgard group archaeon]
MSDQNEDEVSINVVERIDFLVDCSLVIRRTSSVVVSSNKIEDNDQTIETDSEVAIPVSLK